MSSSSADRASRPPSVSPSRSPSRAGSRRPGRPSAEHQAAVARRLDLLRAELSGTPSLTVVPPLGEGGAGSHVDPSRWDVGSGAAAGDLGRATGGEWWADATRLPGLVPGVTTDPAPDLAPEPAGRWADDPSLDEPAPGAPVPGRHASRRRLELLAGLVPESLRGRVAIGNGQLTVVALLLCVGLLVTSWVVVRARPQQVAPVSAPVSAPTAALGPGASTGSDPVNASAVVALDGPAAPSPVVSGGAASAGTSATVTVDVAGKVRHPGIAVLDAGARVVDAIEAAGGARDGVDLTALNLARPLVDGEQVLVGVDPPAGVAAAALSGPPTGGAAGAAGTAGAEGSGVLVNLNTATEAELDTLPDVGPVTAQSIISWREQHGGYTTVDELLEVDGIGEATMTRLAPHVTV